VELAAVGAKKDVSGRYKTGWIESGQTPEGK